MYALAQQGAYKNATLKFLALKNFILEKYQKKTPCAIVIVDLENPAQKQILIF